MFPKNGARQTACPRVPLAHARAPLLTTVRASPLHFASAHAPHACRPLKRTLDFPPRACLLAMTSSASGMSDASCPQGASALPPAAFAPPPFPSHDVEALRVAMAAQAEMLSATSGLVHDLRRELAACEAALNFYKLQCAGLKAALAARAGAGGSFAASATTPPPSVRRARAAASPSPAPSEEEETALPADAVTLALTPAKRPRAALVTPPRIVRGVMARTQALAQAPSGAQAEGHGPAMDSGVVQVRGRGSRRPLLPSALVLAALAALPGTALPSPLGSAATSARASPISCAAASPRRCPPAVSSVFSPARATRASEAEEEPAEQPAAPRFGSSAFAKPSPRSAPASASASPAPENDGDTASTGADTASTDDGEDDGVSLPMTPLRMLALASPPAMPPRLHRPQARLALAPASFSVVVPAASAGGSAAGGRGGAAL